MALYKYSTHLYQYPPLAKIAITSTSFIRREPPFLGLGYIAAKDVDARSFTLLGSPFPRRITISTPFIRERFGGI
jgi:hypothetical protein